MTEPSEFVLEQLREGAGFIVYRGRHRGNPKPVLVVAPAAERQSPQSLRRLEHEYSLVSELDPAWAATGSSAIASGTDSQLCNYAA